MMEARLRRILLRTSVLTSLCFSMLEQWEEMEQSIVIMDRLFKETPIPADNQANPVSEFGMGRH